MTTPRTLTMLLLLATSLNMSTAAACAQDKPATEVQWRTNYADARKEALEKKRPILILCDMKCSTYCVQFKRVTFQDAEVVKLLRTEFVSLTIDSDNWHPLQYLRIEVFPTTVIATHDGRIRSVKVGYVEPTEFREHLRRVLAECFIPDWRTNSLFRRAACYPR